MYGFTIHINLKKEKCSFSFLEQQEKISFKTYSFWYRKFDKFSNDKLFTEEQQYILGLDGVVLNLQELKNEFGITNYTSLLIHLFEKEKIAFVNRLKGEFSGFIFCKKTSILHVFNNKTATKRVFYTKNDDFIAISPSIENLISFKKSNAITSALNVKAVYHFLIFGGLIQDETLVKGVEKLNAGQFLRISNFKLTKQSYHNFNAIDYSITSMDKAIDAIASVLPKAIALNYEKDSEYNYQQLATLSGGLDSRVDVMLAYKMGFKPDTFCFSQSGYLDEKIARKISKNLQLNFSFFPLDGGDYFRNLENMVAINNGLQFYLGSAHFNFALAQIDMSNYGLVHTGLIGDAIFGGHLSKGKPNYFSKTISIKLLHKLDLGDTIKKQYRNEEVFKLYQRQFNLTNFGAYVVENHQSYLVSPFLDDAVIEVALSIDPKIKEHIYPAWFNKHHPEIANYKWERTGFKPNKNWKTEFSRYTKKIIKEYNNFLNRQDRLSMNPLEYWYKNNKKTQEFYQNHYSKNIFLVVKNKELHNDLTMMFSTGNSIEKALVLTLLETIKKYQLTV